MPIKANRITATDHTEWCLDISAKMIRLKFVANLCPYNKTEISWPIPSSF